MEAQGQFSEVVVFLTSRKKNSSHVSQCKVKDNDIYVY